MHLTEKIPLNDCSALLDLMSGRAMFNKKKEEVCWDIDMAWLIHQLIILG